MLVACQKGQDKRADPDQTVSGKGVCSGCSPLVILTSILRIPALITNNLFFPSCANLNKSRLLFSSPEMFKKPLWSTVWHPDQTAPVEAVCSGSTLFASILNSSVMLDNYLQQTTSANDIFRCIFFLAL